MCHKELCHIVAHGQIFFVCPSGAVFTYTFGEICVLFVKCTQQHFILRADSLKGIANHFRRDECFTVGYTLVVFDDLCLDVFKRVVGLDCLLALSLGSIPFGMQTYHPKVPSE